MDDSTAHDFEDGDAIFVEQADGSQRPAVFVGTASWFGGGPTVYVVYPDTHEGDQVAAMRCIAREG
jgi:hypothetical protein